MLSALKFESPSKIGIHCMVYSHVFIQWHLYKDIHPKSALVWLHSKPWTCMISDIFRPCCYHITLSGGSRVSDSTETHFSAEMEENSHQQPVEHRLLVQLLKSKVRSEADKDFPCMAANMVVTRHFDEFVFLHHAQRWNLKELVVLLMLIYFNRIMYILVTYDD